MSRQQALTRIRVAGYHGDRKAFHRVYASARLSYRAADAAYVDGGRAREAGIPCSCPEHAWAILAAIPTECSICRSRHGREIVHASE